MGRNKESEPKVELPKVSYARITIGFGYNKLGDPRLTVKGKGITLADAVKELFSSRRAKQLSQEQKNMIKAELNMTISRCISD